MTAVTQVDDAGSTHPDYLPVDANDQIDPTPPFEFHDPALRADPALPVFNQPGVIIEKITPQLGIKVTGLQLSELDSAGLDQLGLLVAQKGFVVFASSAKMKQNYIDIGMEKQLNIGRHYGLLHRHPTLPHPVSTNEISVVYQDGKNSYSKGLRSGKLSRVFWHHDQPFEPQPPGVTFFACIEAPPEGGDTVFANCQEAFDRLSPAVKKFISNLQLIQSSEGHASSNRKLGTAIRQDYVESHHPLVILHPATGKPAIFFGNSFATQIKGFTDDESHMVLDFLHNYIGLAQDMQARVKWSTGDVCVWDQRVVIHTALVDTEGNHRRHFFRITPLSGVPIPAGEELRKTFVSSRTDGR